MSKEKSFDVELNEALLERKEEIVKGLVAGAIETLNRDMGWRASQVAGEAISDFMKSDVLPQIQEELQRRKPEIVASMLKGIDDALQAAGSKLVEAAAKNLSQSWNLKKLTEAMFG